MATVPVVLILGFLAAFCIEMITGDKHPVTTERNSQQYAEAVYAVTLVLVFTFMPFFYFTILESSRWQGTLGKLALGIKVTDIQGRRISFARAVLRNLGKIASMVILFMGFFMVLMTPRKQALHDMIGGTLVLRAR